MDLLRLSKWVENLMRKHENTLREARIDVKKAILLTELLQMELFQKHMEMIYMLRLTTML